MRNEEIYVTCVCGALVNESDITQHVEDCLKEDFIQNAVSLKISNPSKDGREQPVKARHVCAKCVRCGHPMLKDEGTLITFYPSLDKSFVTCCSYRYKSQNYNQMQDTMCGMCNLPNEFHQHDHQVNEAIDCIDHLESAKSRTQDFARETKCRERRTKMSEFLSNMSEADDASVSEEDCDHEHSVICNDVPEGPPCKQFHVALLRNYNKTPNVDSRSENYSLLLQILGSSPLSPSTENQSDLPVKKDIGIQVKILGVYPDEIEELLTSDRSYSLPNFNPAAEAAFRSHLRTLIPCSYCSRTFSPDRVMRHESCCIERPKTRECITPPGGEIGR